LTDPLTGLANRRAFDQALSRAISGAGRGQAFTLLHLDLDHFKQVNDTLGHAAGDHVLAHVASVLAAHTRRSDVIARIGGDEFMAILHGTCDPDVLSGISARIIAALERPIDYEGNACLISGSIGLARSLAYQRPDGQQMLTDADAALYCAKREGRARARISDPGAEAAA
jgi:diguanylate cyclase (GGDEF)-like protein